MPEIKEIKPVERRLQAVVLQTLGILLNQVRQGCRPLATRQLQLRGKRLEIDAKTALLAQAE